MPPRPTPTPTLAQQVFPEVWSSNGPDGQTYEYKTNCAATFEKLEACLLWDVTRVVVTTPGGALVPLNKDFNINAYSGEVTRRWVLYGPSGGGLPRPGEYRFAYYQGERLLLEQRVSYTPEVVDFPAGVTWRRRQNALAVSWTPPRGVHDGMWYKVLVFPDQGELISQVFPWNATEARLESLPLNDGARARLNVSIFFRGGYAYSEYIPFTW